MRGKKMQIKITRFTGSGHVLEITLTTNNIAHSALSDDEDLRTEITEGIHAALTKHLRKEADKYVKGIEENKNDEKSNDKNN